MKQVFRTLIGLSVALLGGNVAVALSCVQPTLTTAFAGYSDAKELYRVYEGRWLWSGTPPPNGGSSDIAVRMQFVGKGIGLDGPQGPTQRLNVTVQPMCVSAWCGAYPQQGESGIVFIEDVFEDGSQLRVNPSPCGKTTWPSSPNTMQTLVNCLRGRGCQADILSWGSSVD